MVTWNRNEPVAAKRRVQIFVYATDGSPAPATTLFSGNELLVDKGDGQYVAPGGTLSTTDRPIGVVGMRADREHAELFILGSRFHHTHQLYHLRGGR